MEIGKFDSSMTAGTMVRASRERVLRRTAGNNCREIECDRVHEQRKSDGTCGDTWLAQQQLGRTARVESVEQGSTAVGATP